MKKIFSTFLGIAITTASLGSNVIIQNGPALSRFVDNEVETTPLLKNVDSLDNYKGFELRLGEPREVLGYIKRSFLESGIETTPLLLPLENSEYLYTYKGFELRLSTPEEVLPYLGADLNWSDYRAFYLGAGYRGVITFVVDDYGNKEIAFVDYSYFKNDLFEHNNYEISPFNNNPNFPAMRNSPILQNGQGTFGTTLRNLIPTDRVHFRIAAPGVTSTVDVGLINVLNHNHMLIHPATQTVPPSGTLQAFFNGGTGNIWAFLIVNRTNAGRIFSFSYAVTEGPVVFW